MLASHALDPNEKILLNLTETLLGQEYNSQTIYCQNIGIKRRLTNLNFLYSEAKPEQTSDVHSSEKIIEVQEPYLGMVIYGMVGKSTIAILPQKISDMLLKGWSYSSRLELLWAAFAQLNHGAGGDGVVCFPEMTGYDAEFGLSEALRPLGLSHQEIDNNFLLCNPAYCPFIIAEPGLTQEEFSHLELYLRNGGNLILSVDKVAFEGNASQCESITEDQMCLIHRRES